MAHDRGAHGQKRQCLVRGDACPRESLAIDGAGRRDAGRGSRVLSRLGQERGAPALGCRDHGLERVAKAGRGWLEAVWLRPC